MQTTDQAPVPERTTYRPQASSVPPPTGLDLLERPALEAARLTERLVRNVLSGVPQARTDALALAFTATERIASRPVAPAARADTNPFVLELLAPALGMMRRGGHLSEGDAQNLATRLERGVQAWLDLANGAPTDARGAGIGRLGPVGGGAAALFSPYQSAGLLRTLAELSPGGRVRLSPRLGASLMHAAAAHPMALGPGLLSEVLHPEETASLDVIRASLQSTSRLARPAVPPRELCEAAAAGLGEDVPGEMGTSPWVEAARRWSAPEAEGFAAAVATHPGLPAESAEVLLSRLADSEHPRVATRMRTALDTALSTLTVRLGRTPGQPEGLDLDPVLLAAASPGWSDPAHRLSTVRGARALAAAAGRGDPGADVIARDTLEYVRGHTHRFGGPLLAAAALAAGLPLPAPVEPEVVTTPPTTTLGDRIAARLSGGLALALAPFGEAARWAKDLGRRWSQAETGPDRRQAWSALTLAAELVADGRVPATRPDLLARLLRESGTRQGISGAGEGAEMVAHRRELENHLDRVAAAPLPIGVELGQSVLPVNVRFVPGWRMGLSLEAAERERRQPGWEPRQAARWLEPGTVAVLAEGEVCGWIQPGEGPVQFHGPSVRHALGHARDGQEMQMRSALLAAAAVAVAAEQGVGVHGEGFGEALHTLGGFGGQPALQQVAADGRNEVTADEVQRFAAAAGWRSQPVTPEAPDLVLADEAADRTEAPRVSRGRGR